MKTNTNLIAFFNTSIIDNTSKLDFASVNAVAVKLGYFVHPDACNKSTMEFLKSKQINPNSTFYKTWEEVTSKSRFELLIDQLLHYATTYGTDFSEGNGYVPNDGDIVLTEQEFAEYKVISACTAEEMYDKCYKVLCSGIALKQNTVNVLCEYVTDYYKENKADFNIDKITNKEAVTILCDMLGITPNKKFDLFRYIIYKTTGSSLIINNNDTFRNISYSVHPFDFSVLSESQMTGLASIYRRFKNIFCAFKHNPYNTTNRLYINKLNRLAAKYHTPLKKGFWETVMSTVYTQEEVEEQVANVDNFKIIKILQCLAERLAAIMDNSNRFYLIRNGKCYVKEDNDAMSIIFKNFTYYNMLADVLRGTLINRLREKACYVKFPKNYTLAVPTSEKNFVGNLPFGTYFDMAEDNIIGIYWRNEWGTHDFDLSMNDENNVRIGWNSSYYTENANIVYSGDMTNADPEAAELLYTKKNCPNGCIYVNRFNGSEGSKFQLFYAQEDLSTNKNLRNYMCDPSSIKVQEEIVSNQRQQMIGLIKNNRFYIMSVDSGNSRVASANNLESRRFNAIVSKAKSFINLKSLLNDAGFIDVDNISEEDWNQIIEENPDTKVLDLSNVNKDTLINLFSN